MSTNVTQTVFDILIGRKRKLTAQDRAMLRTEARDGALYSEATRHNMMLAGDGKLAFDSRDNLALDRTPPGPNAGIKGYGRLK